MEKKIENYILSREAGKHKVVIVFRVVKDCIRTTTTTTATATTTHTNTTTTTTTITLSSSREEKTKDSPVLFPLGGQRNGDKKKAAVFFLIGISPPSLPLLCFDSPVHCSLHNRHQLHPQSSLATSRTAAQLVESARSLDMYE